MAKKLSELYAPKPKDEKAFVAKHGLKKTTDKSPATKDNARFNGSNVKTFNRSEKRMGYNPGDDEKAYGVVPETPAPTDQKTVTAVAPYTVKVGEDLTDDDIDELLDMLGEILINEMEELDELSPGTLKSYVKKAGDEMDATKSKHGVLGPDRAKKFVKRRVGIGTAASKIQKGTK